MKFDAFFKIFVINSYFNFFTNEPKIQHDGGDFVFTLRTASLGTATPAPPPSLPAEAPLPPAPVVL
ncbi:MAG: hypothetical protein HY097_06510 [Nitrospinae bacterium]|nr:hypothetical protein [Nitrospinota bacterium]MBI3814821.1 hypothetical protein [Nitrospinota bacterium]